MKNLMQGSPAKRKSPIKRKLDRRPIQKSSWWTISSTSQTTNTSTDTAIGLRSYNGAEGDPVKLHYGKFVFRFPPAAK